MFTAEEQRVSVTGPHAYLAAGPNDFRGPCPGLNAMANHKYIPHDGIVCLADVIVASKEGASLIHAIKAMVYVQGWIVFGFGLDIGLISAVLGLYGADILNLPCVPLSIGGAPLSGGILGILPILGSSRRVLPVDC